VSGFAFLFPGQGSQHAGMGRELFEAFPESREVFETADEALGRPLSQVCFEGPAEELTLTETTQPAILTVSIAALRALEARGLRPIATAGHSLGEYSAHVAAGTFEFTDAVRTVQSRGRFMQDAVPVGVGSMAAVLGLDREAIEDLCRSAAGDEIVTPANLNAPGQIVIAGHAVAVERAVAASREAGSRKALTLPVSAPFHCPLMRPAADRLSPVLDAIEMRSPAVPVYTNVDAEPVATAEQARSALVRQVASPVRWHELIEAMVRAGIDTFVEVGPGKVLSGLVRRIHKPARVLADRAGPRARRRGGRRGGQGPRGGPGGGRRDRVRRGAGPRHRDGYLGRFDRAGGDRGAARGLC
jgi:[acyl-carrier-protein] S-malonyltransferase